MGYQIQTQKVQDKIYVRGVSLWRKFVLKLIKMEK
jgi:hypothetical protein